VCYAKKLGKNSDRITRGQPYSMGSLSTESQTLLVLLKRVRFQENGGCFESIEIGASHERLKASVTLAFSASACSKVRFRDMLVSIWEFKLHQGVQGILKAWWGGKWTETTRLREELLLAKKKTSSGAHEWIPRSWPTAGGDPRDGRLEKENLPDSGVIN